MRFVRSAGVALLAAVVATILAVVAQMLAGYAYVWGKSAATAAVLVPTNLKWPVSDNECKPERRSGKEDRRRQPRRDSKEEACLS
jgi:hypothetical protein